MSASGAADRGAARKHAEHSCERIVLVGHVQGVGFRPFVYRLAERYGLAGHVQNRLGEVEIVAAGLKSSLARFSEDLIAQSPPLSRPVLIERESIALPATLTGFEIRESSADAEAHVFVPPDYFMCDDCRQELFDPDDRRYRYPFINCTQCGPRYTLIESMPYDRPNTSMRDFPLCADCRREYNDPGDRRFHAEPVACAVCGPDLEYHSAEKTSHGSAALDDAIALVAAGGILAVKGIGGYHLLCDAINADAVGELRQRKQRPGKPFAVMFPARGRDGLRAVRECVEIDAPTAELVSSPARPIVLAPQHRAHGLADNVAPGLAELGVFLPYSPLHELLLDALDTPVVATSGNLSGEPVLTDKRDAERRLGRIADAFLHHDRPIVRPADDPVFRNVCERLQPIRIGRGNAPRERRLPQSISVPTLAVGAHMKNTIALAWDDRVVVSPHIGEMDAPRSLAVLEQVADNLQALYGVAAARIVCDAHPGYTTHRWARRHRLPVETVWHHDAHASALVGEDDRPGNWLVFAWDGVGLGRDGSLWGGEALIGRPGAWRRVASMRPFRLPGGDRAGREPWRSAAALHWECGRDWRPDADRVGLARAAWERRLNCPRTSSVGRLFDAAAAVVLGQHVVSYEAEGPMRLEALCRAHRRPVRLPLGRNEENLWISDWAPLLDVLADSDPVRAAERFHSSLAQVVVDQARVVAEQHPVTAIGLTGGVFQNRMLSGQAAARLRAQGFRVHLARELPCNDAAISFGQVIELGARDAL